MTWLVLSLFGVAMQTTRNGLARSLSSRFSASMNSWSRFFFGLPYAAVLMAMLSVQRGVPEFSFVYLLFCLSAALSQLLANVALIAAFQRSNFSQSIVMHKLDAVFGALLGVIFFAERPSMVGWVGILISTLGMLLINLAREPSLRGWRRALHLDIGAVLSLTCAALLALTSFMLKEAVAEFVLLNPRVGQALFEGAAHTLFHVLWMEVALLTIAQAVRAPHEFRHVRNYGGRMALIGLSAFAGSLAWLWAFSMTLVAYVRAVGQIEAVFAVALSFYLFGERSVLWQIPGVVCVTGGIALLLVG